MRNRINAKKEGKVKKARWAVAEELRSPATILNMLPRWMRNWAAPQEHTHTKENARRLRQIERGILKPQNRGINGQA